MMHYFILTLMLVISGFCETAEQAEAYALELWRSGQSEDAAKILHRLQLSNPKNLDWVYASVRVDLSLGADSRAILSCIQSQEFWDERLQRHCMRLKNQESLIWFAISLIAKAENGENIHTHPQLMELLRSGQELGDVRVALAHAAIQRGELWIAWEHLRKARQISADGDLGDWLRLNLLKQAQEAKKDNLSDVNSLIRPGILLLSRVDKTDFKRIFPPSGRRLLQEGAEAVSVLEKGILLHSLGEREMAQSLFRKDQQGTSVEARIVVRDLDDEVSSDTCAIQSLFSSRGEIVFRAYQTLHLLESDTWQGLNLEEFTQEFNQLRAQWVQAGSRDELEYLTSLFLSRYPEIFATHLGLETLNRLLQGI